MFIVKMHKFIVSSFSLKINNSQIMLFVSKLQSISFSFFCILLSKDLNYVIFKRFEQVHPIAIALVNLYSTKIGNHGTR